MIHSNPILEQVEREYVCSCERQALRFFHKANNQIEYRLQCLGCGKMVQAVKQATLTPREKMAATEWDESIRDEYWRRRNQRYQDLANEGRRLESAQWWEKYGLYLQSPEWKTVRAAVLKRCNYTCEGCGRARATEAHHLTYEHVGHELLFELVGLCHDCHQAADNKTHGTPEAHDDGTIR